MKMNRFTSSIAPVALAAALVVTGCSKKAAPNSAEQPQQYPQQAPNAASQQATNPGAAAPTQPPPPPADAAPASPTAMTAAPNAMTASPTAMTAAPVNYTIPRGSHLRVTLNQALGSKLSQAGQGFSATVATPIVVRGVTIVRSGSTATGTVIAAKSLGRFKGQAELAIRLDSVRSDGKRYEVDTSSIERVEKGKGKRTAVLTGGGTGLGALIGGLAGGGKGALIGGLAGAGAGAGGSAFTGNKEIVIPAETTLTFRLLSPVTVSK